MAHDSVAQVTMVASTNVIPNDFNVTHFLFSTNIFPSKKISIQDYIYLFRATIIQIYFYVFFPRAILISLGNL